MDYQKEISKFKVISFFSGMIFTLSFLTPFYLSKGLNAYQILLMQSVYLGTILLLEVPSGAFSDLFGRKTTLILSFLAFVIAWLLLFIAHDFFTFLPYQIVFALGISLKSGTYSAYIYELCHIDGTDINYGQIMASISRMKLLAAAISAFTSSVLYYYGGFRLVLILTIISAAISFVFVVLLKPIEENNQNNDKPKFYEVLKKGVIELKSSKLIIIAATNAVIGSVFINTFFHFNQLILKDSGFPVSLNGIFMGTVFLLSSFVMKKISEQLKLLNNTVKSLVGINILMLVVLVIIQLTAKSIVVSVFLMLLLLGNHIRIMFSNKMLNESISNDNRATTLSYVSLLQSLGAMLLAPIYGKLYDINGGLVYIVITIFSIVTINVFMVNTLTDNN